MQAPVLHQLNDQNLWLSANRAIYWEEAKALILSDAHIGKTGHFRKSGIAVPQKVYKEDLQRLVEMLQYFKPGKLIAVGDLFHSHANQELLLFQKWRQEFSDLAIDLVKGNHDILNQKWYADLDINIIEPTLHLGPFSFTHDECDTTDGSYHFCGHLHPGIVVHGMGKQSLRFPCFYFTENKCILPAFSRFTGMASIEPYNGDIVYDIVNSELIKFNN